MRYSRPGVRAPTDARLQGGDGEKLSGGAPRIEAAGFTNSQIVFPLLAFLESRGTLLTLREAVKRGRPRTFPCARKGVLFVPFPC